MTIIPIIAGPTASGKSAHALLRARDEQRVILNADAIQLYRGLPILTACPPIDDMNAVPHHLYEICDPFTPCTVTDWLTLIHREIEAAQGRVIIVGGSGFYIKALTEGLSPIPDIEPHIREKLMQQLSSEGLPALYSKLQHTDPTLAERLKPGDTQRICRGLEVFLATGRTLSSWQSEPKVKLPYEFDITLIMPERETLYQRCDARFLQMIDHGVIEEVKSFIQSTNDQPNQLSKALGFNQIRAYLKGELELENAINLAQIATRQFAKRQVTWFRHQVSF